VSARSHPADAILARYAVGALRPGFDLVVGVHLETCARCRETVRRFEAAAGALMDETPAEPLSEDALAHTLARLEREPRWTADAAASGDRRPLADRLPLKRRRWLGPGSWIQPIDAPHLPGDRVYLLRVAGGVRGLDHGHSGAEFTAVISGALRDSETVFRAGDFFACDPSLRHWPESLPDDGGCLCLAATEGGLMTQGWLPGLIRAWARV
jgi:putative transcriptional regulator